MQFAYNCTLWENNSVYYVQRLFAKTNKGHFKNKWADCHALFSTYSAIWTVNTFCQKSRYCLFQGIASSRFTAEADKRLDVFEQKPISPF